MIYVLVMLPLLMLTFAEDLLHHSWGVAAALILLPAGAWLLGRWQGARSGQVVPRRDRNRAELAQLRAPGRPVRGRRQAQPGCRNGQL